VYPLPVKPSTESVTSPLLLPLHFTFFTLAERVFPAKLLDGILSATSFVIDVPQRSVAVTVIVCEEVITVPEATDCVIV
jgi:hypothetical protein